MDADLTRTVTSEGAGHGIDVTLPFRMRTDVPAQLPASARGPLSLAPDSNGPVVSPLAAIPRAPRRRIFSVFVSDVTALVLSALLGLLLLNLFHTTPRVEPALMLLVLVPAMTIALVVHGVYRQRRLLVGVEAPWRALAQAMASGILLTLVVSEALEPAVGPSMTVSEAAAGALPALLLLPALRIASRRMPVGARGATNRVLIVGSGKVAERVRERLERHGDTVVVGLVDDDPQPGTVVLGGLDSLPTLVAENDVDQVLVAFSRTPSHESLDILRSLGASVSISVVPRMYELLSWRSTITELHGLPLLYVAPPQLSVSARVAKRTLDLAVACLAVLLCSPLLLVVAVAVRMTSPGPVLFRQLRVGRGGVPFAIYKFRTMFVDAEECKSALSEVNESDGPLFKIHRDPRVTRIGGFLRKTSLDELPQLFNVIKGDMSLVGPRPFILSESAQFEGGLLRRFDVPPGMTGLWQISGRNDLSYDDLCHLDTVYVSSWSFWWDLRILAKTPASVLRRRGAY